MRHCAAWCPFCPLTPENALKGYFFLVWPAETGRHPGSWASPEQGMLPCLCTGCSLNPECPSHLVSLGNPVPSRSNSHFWGRLFLYPLPFTPRTVGCALLYPVRVLGHPSVSPSPRGDVLEATKSSLYLQIPGSAGY